MHHYTCLFMYRPQFVQNIHLLDTLVCACEITWQLTVLVMQNVHLIINHIAWYQTVTMIRICTTLNNIIWFLANSYWMGGLPDDRTSSRIRTDSVAQRSQLTRWFIWMDWTWHYDNTNDLIYQWYTYANELSDEYRTTQPPMDGR